MYIVDTLLSTMFFLDLRIFSHNPLNIYRKSKYFKSENHIRNWSQRRFEQTGFLQFKQSVVRATLPSRIYYCCQDLRWNHHLFLPFLVFLMQKLLPLHSCSTLISFLNHVVLHGWGHHTVRIFLLINFALREILCYLREKVVQIPICTSIYFSNILLLP